MSLFLLILQNATNIRTTLTEHTVKLFQTLHSENIRDESNVHCDDKFSEKCIGL